MKRIFFVLIVLVVAANFAGCRKDQSMENPQEQVSMESLSGPMVETKAQAPEVKVSAQATPAPQMTEMAAPDQEEGRLEPVPSGPYRPKATEIQTALKNAGYYEGSVDGKIGPMTKKAIEKFQEANQLKPDGKVGPKTWVALSKYLTTGSTAEKR